MICASVKSPDRPTYVGWAPCISWCEEHLYYSNHNKPCWRYVGEGVFEFENEKDYTMFMLRWG